MAICPQCGSTNISYYGMNPVQGGACCNSCGFSVSGGQKGITEAFASGYSYAALQKINADREADAKRKANENRLACERIAHQREVCRHTWQRCTQDGHSYECCQKCGDSRPIGGGSW